MKGRYMRRSAMGSRSGAKEDVGAKQNQEPRTIRRMRSESAGGKSKRERDRQQSSQAEDRAVRNNASGDVDIGVQVLADRRHE